jgi:hypothetical protein
MFVSHPAPKRKAYLCTSEENTPRKLFSIQLLLDIGFEVCVVPYFKHFEHVLSNKKTMMYIYERIVESGEPYSYVFEDDINTLEPVRLSDIIKYEKISPYLFFLGCCIPDYQNKDNYKIHEEKIDHREITILSGAVRGLHAIGLSSTGAQELLEFAKKSPQRYMDMILDAFTTVYPANVFRYDLESYIQGHRGMFFQDRNRFPSNLIE